MKPLLQFLKEQRDLWRLWLVLPILAFIIPLFALAIPLIQRRLIDDVILPQRLDLLPGTAAMFAGVWLASTLCIAFGSLLNTYLRERMLVRLRERLIEQSEHLSVSFSERVHSGRTTSLFLNDAGIVAGLLTDTTMSALGSILTLVFGIALMLRLNVELALATAVGPPLVAFAAMVITRPLRPAARRAQEKVAELTERLQENLAGLREIVAFGRGSTERAGFGATMSQLLRLNMRVASIDSAIQSGAGLFTLAVTLTTLVYGGYLVIEARTSLGTLLAMQLLFGIVFQPAGQVVRVISTIQKGLGAADRLFGFLDEVPSVPEYEDAQTPEHVAGEVTFEDVSFAYRPGEPVLRDISFTAAPGEMIALVGPSGAGKTTLVSLITRFHDPDEGAVLLDGADLRDLTLAGLRGHIGIAFQDTFLFAKSIRENIGFGREGATNEEIEAAAWKANALEFIQRLPQGFDTQAGERGVQLSEGQRQRLAIARALLRDPRILILDEPTAALDARSEHLLQAALDTARRGRTTFVIAHRLATIRRADRILVMDAGRIVQQGTHDELVGQQGLYRDLFSLQYGSAAQQESDNGAIQALAALPARIAEPV
jgi:ATP-binding cassette, subfamily B, bacterial MsbA